MTFWIENILISVFFLLYELVILPFAYLRVWTNLFKNSPSFFVFFLNFLLFSAFGPFLMIFFIFKDCSYFFTILRYLNGCKSGKVDELAEIEVDQKTRMQLYNEVRATVIHIYKKMLKYIQKE